MVLKLGFLQEITFHHVHKLIVLEGEERVAGTRFAIHEWIGTVGSHAKISTQRRELADVVALGLGPERLRRRHDTYAGILPLIHRRWTG